jgi:hypothetical protein
MTTFDPTSANREALEDHIVEDCPRMCGGDPQVLADLDDATDAELAAYVADTHTWHESNALPTGGRA